MIKILTDPEWLQAIAAIAALPITIIAIIKLFIKDKERERNRSTNTCFVSSALIRY